MKPARWYYVVAGEQRGPIDLETLIDLLRADTLPADTLVWRPGRDGWSPADAVAEIESTLPPPIPSSASSRPSKREPPPIPPIGTATPGTSPGDTPSDPPTAVPPPGSFSPGRTATWLTVSVVVLLLVDAGGCAYLLSRPMKDSTKVAGAFSEATFRIALLSAFIAAIVPALRKRFVIAASLLFAIPMTIFLGVLTFQAMTNDQLIGHLSEFARSNQASLDAVRQGKAGGLTALSPGNPMAGAQTLLMEMAGTFESMQKEIDATRAGDVLGLDVLEGRDRLAKELQARHQQREILRRYRTVLLAKIDSWQPVDMGLGGEMQASMEKGARDGLARSRAQMEQIFAQRQRAVASEMRLLQFLRLTAGQYEVAQGQLIARRSGWAQRYRGLSQAVLDGRREQEELAASMVKDAEKQLNDAKALMEAR